MKRVIFKRKTEQTPLSFSRQQSSTGLYYKTTQCTTQQTHTYNFRSSVSHRQSVAGLAQTKAESSEVLQYRQTITLLSLIPTPLGNETNCLDYQDKIAPKQGQVEVE